MDSHDQTTNKIIVKIRTNALHKVLRHAAVGMVKSEYLMVGKSKLDLEKAIVARHSFWIQANQVQSSAERAKCIEGDPCCSVYCHGGLQNVTVPIDLHQSTSQLLDYVVRTCCALVALVAIDLNFRKSAIKTGVDLKV